MRLTKLATARSHRNPNFAEIHEIACDAGRMATWKQFETEAPNLAAEIRERFEAHETHVLATLRKDGSPRVSGSEVAFSGDDLTFGSMPGARKARDLLRDGRCAIHAHPAMGDAKVAGIAIPLPSTGFHAFRLDLTEAVLTDVDEERELLFVQVWRPGHEVAVRTRK